MHSVLMGVRLGIALLLLSVVASVQTEQHGPHLTPESHKERGPNHATSHEDGKDTKHKTNVILVMVDDLRPEITSFLDAEKRPWLNPHIQTPHLDKLASRSAVLTKAYVQEAICNPSRTSILTGRRPDTTGVTGNKVWFRETGNPDIITLPQYFQDSGYTTVGVGKVFHLLRGYHQDKEHSWTRFRNFHSSFNENKVRYAWRAMPSGNSNETLLVDQFVTEDAIDELDNVSETYNDTGKPFFLAVGYRRPHLPWIFPERFSKFYPVETIEPPLNPFAPYKMPKEAWFNSIEFLNHLPVDRSEWFINSTLSQEQVIEARQAYYSCVSHVDHEIGLLMNHIESLGLLDNTVIALLGDHGWQLGEHGIWGKNTNFEEATNAPLMISIPGLTDEGKKVDELVEFVDIFPTLVDAAGLNMPPLCPETNARSVNLCREGSSLLPLLKDEANGKEAVFSQYPSSSSMGYSARTARYRYTEWQEVAAQLFDLERDPLEQYNRAGDEEYSDAVSTMSQVLQKGWRGCLH